MPIVKGPLDLPPGESEIHRIFAREVLGADDSASPDIGTVSISSFPNICIGIETSHGSVLASAILNDTQGHKLLDKLTEVLEQRERMR